MRNSIAAPVDLPRSQTTNPYWDIMRTFPGSGIDWQYDSVWSPDWSSAYMDGIKKQSRNDLCREYTWSIPDPITLEFITEWVKPAAIEMGAGTGYWAWQLSQLDVNIIAFDEVPPQIKSGNHWHSPRDEQEEKLQGKTRSVFFDVQEGTPETLEKYADRILFLCWPPKSDMALECLKHYQGKRLVYIGEGDGGCTASEEFFEKLEQEWEEKASHRPIQWSGIHDYVTVYERIEVQNV